MLISEVVELLSSNPLKVKSTLLVNIKYAFEDKTGIEYIVFFGVYNTFIGMIHNRFLSKCVCSIEPPQKPVAVRHVPK